MLQCTLTPNRSDRTRGVRLIKYGLTPGGHLEPATAVLTGSDWTLTEHPYSQIRGSDVDPEFAAAWRAHLRAQEVRNSDAPSVTRADLIARGDVIPCRNVYHATCECKSAAALLVRARVALGLEYLRG